MQELVGRLTALDPEASETLKVVSYFDALIAGGVGIEALLRGAAALSGVPVGYATASRRLRISAEGARLEPGDAPTEPAARRAVGVAAAVWLERGEHAHANDAMVLERLAIALAIVEARRTPGETGSLEIALNEHAGEEERAVAVARLRLDARDRVRLVAVPADATAPEGLPSAVIATPYGLARAVVVADADVAAAIATGRAGVGLALPPERMPESWASALIALRLGSTREPVVEADELGAMLLVAAAADERRDPHPDALALAGLDERTLGLLDALAATGSVRAAATGSGLHHSTVQERLGGLAGKLGYDPRTPHGRTRYALARMLLTLSSPLPGAAR